MQIELELAMTAAVSVGTAIGTAIGTITVLKRRVAEIFQRQSAAEQRYEEKSIACSDLFKAIGESIKNLEITTARMDSIRTSVRDLELNATRIDQRLTDVVERIDTRLDTFIQRFDKRVDVLIGIVETHMKNDADIEKLKVLIEKNLDSFKDKPQ